MNQALTQNRKWIGYGFRGGMAIFAPFLMTLIPGFEANNYTYSILNFAMIYSIVGIGLSLLTGYAGQISLGHSGLMAIGAYTAAQTSTGFGMPFFVSLLFAMVFTGFIGFLLALPALRLSGPYLAVATVGFGVAVPQIIKYLNFRTDGIEGLKIDKPNLPGFSPEADLARYYMILPIVAIVFFVATNLTRTKVGRAFLAIRETEIAAQAMGVGLARYKVIAFTISAAMTGIAGALYVGQIGRISSEEFNLLQSILFLVIIAIGGLNTLGGAVAGALLMTILPEFVNRLSNFLQESLNNAGINVQLKNPQYILYGLLIILFVMFLPEGLAGAWQRILNRFWPAPPEVVVTTTADHSLQEQIRVENSEQQAKPGLEINHLTMRFGGITAVSDFSMTLKPGEIVGLIGPNGAGKTTVFNCLSSFYRPNEGQLLWEGLDITHQPAQDKLKVGIARTFQNLELFNNLSVMDNLLIGQHPRLKQSLWSSMLLTPATHREEKLARQRAREILAFLEISDTEKMRPGSLPFGKQKRVELARALVSRPRLILLDEPAAGANNRETADLAKLIRRIRDEFGIAVLLVEHDMSFVMNLCERLYVLDFGKKIAEGTPDKVQSDPAVIEAYLGEREELVDTEEERNTNEATTKSAPERT